MQRHGTGFWISRMYSQRITMSIMGHENTKAASVKPLNMEADVNTTVAENPACVDTAAKEMGSISNCNYDGDKAPIIGTDIAKFQYVHLGTTVGDDEARDDENDVGDGDDSVVTTDISESTSFEIDVIEELSIPLSRSNSAPGLEACDDFSSEDDEAHCPPFTNINFCPRMQSKCTHEYTHVAEIPDFKSMDRGLTHDETSNPPEKNTVIQNIVEDFSSKGDQKILRAMARTATVNAAVLITAVTGGAAGAVGYVTGGAIMAKRLSDGIIQNDEKEVTKSLAVYGCATGASIAGQAITGAVMIGVVGASLPLAGAVAFGVGCCSGIAAGALSEWTVDSVIEKAKSLGRKGRNNALFDKNESDPLFSSSNEGY
mmetsp:Transcript_16599/g.30033  ORF Transcript_16599/g.30033 Transcript_16599/m.30033 type:complete len:372 (+) Transcript_16599:136-1251(+)